MAAVDRVRILVVGDSGNKVYILRYLTIFFREMVESYFTAHLHVIKLNPETLLLKFYEMVIQSLHQKQKNGPKLFTYFQEKSYVHIN